MRAGKIVPAVTQPGADNNLGSTVITDVNCLQSLSKRTHMGMFVAEAKFRSNRELYTRLIEEDDRDAIMDSLTDAAVERRVAMRVRNKAATYGQTVDDVLPSLGEARTENFKVAPESVADLYVNWLMPLTKFVQVRRRGRARARARLGEACAPTDAPPHFAPAPPPRRDDPRRAQVEYFMQRLDEDDRDFVPQSPSAAGVAT